MVRWLLLFLTCSSCFLRVEKTPINTPQIDQTYYESSIEALEEAIQDHPDYLPYIVQQLSYYERLGWPSTALDAIKRAERLLVNDQGFFNQKINFYQKNQMYESLADELKKYPVSGRLPLKLQLTYTDALIQMGDSINAAVQLEDMRNFSSDSTFEFVAKGYLRLGDTLQYMQLLYQQQDLFGQDLIDIYFTLQLWDSVRTFSVSDPELFSSIKNKRILAKSYLAVDSLRIAEQLVKDDTTFSGKMLLLEAYEKQYKWVSASRVLDQLLAVSPQEVALLNRRARIADRRGYFESALYYANQALNLDSTNQEAKRLLDQITNKIAYLRQQQEEQQIMPMLGLDSLKKGM